MEVIFIVVGGCLSQLEVVCNKGRYRAARAAKKKKTIPHAREKRKKYHMAVKEEEEENYHMAVRSKWTISHLLGLKAIESANSIPCISV